MNIISAITVSVLVSGCVDAEALTASNPSQLTANPCTAVALTTPVQAFTAVVGSPIALSASATCPAGVTPEFEFWMKAPGDANWNSTALGGYVPAGATFTPTVAADLCFSVAVRAIGSTDSFQARSSGACGTVTGPDATPLTIRTFWPRQVAGNWLPKHIGALSFLESTDSTNTVIDIPTSEGDRIVALTYEASGASSCQGCLPGTSTALDYSASTAGFSTPTVIGDNNDLGTSAAWRTVIVVLEPTTIGPGGALAFLALTSGPGYRIGLVRASFQHTE